jgi:hypothetical protein
MRVLTKCALAAAALSIVSGANAQSDPMAKYRKKLMSRTLADYAAAVTVHDDSLSTMVVISTERAGRTKGHIPMGEGDVLLRAVIDKKTGIMIYQVVGSIGYWGGWRFYDTVNYSPPDGPVQTSAKPANRAVVTCMSAAGCKYEETVVVDVDEQVLRAIAGSSEPWRFRFSGGGPAWNEEMNAAEVKALLDRVVAYKANLAQPSG